MNYLYSIFATMALVFCSHAQSVKAGVNRHFWAGGMCCSSGTDYTFSITLRQTGFQCFDSLLMETDGFRLTVADNQLTRISSGDSLITFSYQFGLRSNSRMDVNDYQVQYYGTNGRQLVRQEPFGNRIVLIRRKDREELTGIVATETMTAYP